MSCNLNRIFAFLTVLIAGAAATASAQQASFHLPVEAKWGTLVLPPGDYRFHVPDAASGPVISVQGAAVGFVLPLTIDTNGARYAALDHDCLQLVKIGDIYYVTKFEEASRDITLYFKTPKQPHQERMASRDIINIPVKRS